MAEHSPCVFLGRGTVSQGGDCYCIWLDFCLLGLSTKHPIFLGHLLYPHHFPMEPALMNGPFLHFISFYLFQPLSHSMEVTSGLFHVADCELLEDWVYLSVKDPKACVWHQ